jgi:hypothetical protein
MSMPTTHPPTLFELLSGFQRELEHVLRELNSLSSSCTVDVERPLRELHEELRRAIYQLESTLDFLIPLENHATEPPQLPLME